jgi:ketosteroid isomerase-like protein
VDAIMKGYVPGSELFVFDLGLPRQHAGWDAYKKDWQDFFDALQGPPKVEISSRERRGAPGTNTSTAGTNPWMRAPYA